MAKRRIQQPHIRKPLLIAGGATIGVALLASVLMSFTGGGVGGEAAAPSSSPKTSTPSDPAPKTGAVKRATLREGGRNPFQPVVNTQAAAAPAPTAPPAAAPAAQVGGVPVSELKYMMLYKVVFDGKAAYMQYDDSGARQLVAVADKTWNGYVVQSIGADCADFTKDGKTVHLCTGDRAPV